MKKFLILLLMLLCGIAGAQTVRVGAKHFNEGYILGEILSQLLEGRGMHVERVFNLGGTLVCYEALVNGQIDIYPEYTGTISEAILKSGGKHSYNELKQLLNEKKLDVSAEYGFDNTYALAVRKKFADSLGLNSVSDLRNHPDIKAGLSYEFLNREDGWKNLAGAYGLKQEPTGLEHGLAYSALADGRIDVTDVYSTDGEIPQYDLKILNDDLLFFPSYRAVSFYRTDTDGNVKKIADLISGIISEDEMQEMNAEVLYKNKSAQEVAGEFLKKKNLLGESHSPRKDESLIETILPKAVQHLKLTLISLMAAVVIAIPLGILVYRISALSKPVIYAAGLLQTIPSIALLAFMIPLFGIGMLPAVVALFLYGLLPILRNTVSALNSVDPLIREVASGIGLSDGEKLRHIELPLSMPVILAGIRTSAVINIGTATLAAFIGAGGLGEFIVTGLALNDTKLILTGAVPAAILAVLTELVFELLERILFPKHLKLNPAAK